MKKLKVLGIFFLGLISHQMVASELPADKLLTQFDRLVQGEFDNYNQVNFETNGFLPKGAIPEDKHHRLYKKVTKLNAPQLGEYVYFEQTHTGGKDKPVYRKTIAIAKPDYQSNEIVVEQFKVANDFDVIENQSSLAVKSLTSLGKHCQARYQQLGKSFVGKIDRHTCQVVSKHGGKVFIGGNFVISEQGYWHLEAGYDEQGNMRFGRKDYDYYQLTRARQFKCWAAFKTDKFKDNGEAKWDFHPNIMLHNQGDIAEFTTTETQPKSYFIRLKETIFPAGNRPDVIEIFVHENSQVAKKSYKKALSYTWANADATRLGINLRWMQTSCHQI
ncbi:hypothetical protein HII17_14935 [Thalassotalea sp. M1531]|uniref:Uncharacterized protein n=1 Tax=Thalassotalea algicola TaxID=2716224 RepID=A0A7Y0LE23_9GAMM|nr:CpcT/CpeT family chromophore lyase [Thalassotalea algicola]NMP32850.1 hypothetical protein [Thalassotalea algicola]